MGSSAIFGTAIFGEAIFGMGGAATLCLEDTYTSSSAFHTAIEATDDTKFLGVLTFREFGTSLEKIVTITKV